MTPRRPLVLVDTATLYYRAYFGLPDSMTAPDGHPHNAVRGLLDFLTRLVDQLAPSGLAACWDVDWRPQWRVDLLESYKTHRLEDEESGQETEPDTLGPQIGAIAAILDAMGVARPGARGYEADDIVATLAARADGPVVVVSGDRDLVQVVSDSTHLLLAVNGGMPGWPLLGPEQVAARFGVRPEQYVDFAVLRGDPSDGIPGAPGIGAKTAAALIASYGDLDALLAAAATNPERPLTPRLAGILDEHAELLLRSRQVARAALDAPVDPKALALPTKPADAAALDELASEWGVQRFTNAFGEALRKAAT